jgi:O-antigen/teichoic acid export membrane protein
VNLIKTSFYTSISTAITFISGFVVTKVVALKIGPSGMAYVGQYQNTTTILSMFAMAAIGAGIIKYLAEYTGDTEKQQQVISTSLSIVLVSSFIISLLVMAICRKQHFIQLIFGKFTCYMEFS